ncbi:MAG TPA: YfhO family protein [Verrucomicrobiae bacterium]|nr:YfhO family protein [Verrucomicrobiae bacterium]
MSEPSENRPAAFTPARFGLLLALLVFAAFPQVILGLETFVARDYGFFAYPLAHFQQDCFRHGELPFWNPYNNCGVPFLAQWNTMPLYPPALFYLALPLTWSLGMFSLLHLWWAGFGMYLLARRWTGNNFAAAFAGTAFSFNGFTLNLLMWPSHIATFSWLPWVIMATECAWLKGGRKIFLAGIVGAFQMLAGGPETILLTWLIVTALWLQHLIRAEIPRATLIARFLLVPLFVFALSAAQLLPFLDLVSHAQREAGYTDLRWSMPGSGLANFLVPMAFGSTVTEGIFFQNGQAWTSSYYLGLGALWLMLLAALCVRERRVWLLGGATVISLLCAFGENTPVYPLLRHLIPQLSFITYPVKYIMVAVFAAPLLAAFALANIEKFPKKIYPIGAILFAFIIGILFWTQHAPQPGNDAPAALHNGITRAVFLLLTGAAFYFLTRTKKSPLLRFAPLGLILIAWFDVYTHEPRQNPTVPSGVYEQNLARTKLAMSPQPELGGSRAMLSPAAALELTQFAAKDAQNNFLAKRAGLCANVNLLDSIPKVDGFFSLAPHDFDVLISLMYGDNGGNWSHLEDFLGASQTIAPGKLLDWQPRTSFQPLITAGQRPVFLDDTNTLRALGQNNFDGASMVFLPPSEKDFVTVTNQTAAKILSSKFTDRTADADLDAAEPSLVMIAQTYYHDWNVIIDGQPARLLRANFAFQAVQVPAGKHTVHLFYHDSAFQLGAVISGIGWIMSLAAILFWRRRA